MSDFIGILTECQLAPVRVSREEARRVRERREMPIFYIFILEMTSYPVTLLLSLEANHLVGPHSKEGI